MDAIVFDLDGTIVQYNQNYDKILERTFIDTVGFSKTRWINKYTKDFFDNLNNFVKRPYYNAMKNLDVDYPARNLVNVLQENELESLSLSPKCKENLNKLSKEYKLGLLTNGVDDWQMNKIKQYNLDEYFDNITISYNIGYHKPHIKIYKYVQDNLLADNYSFISDEYSDLRGGRISGWEGYKYNKQDFTDISKIFLDKIN